MKNSKTAAATAATLSYTASPVHALNSFGYSFTTPQNIHYFFIFAPPYQTILSTADSLISSDMCGVWRKNNRCVSNLFQHDRFSMVFLYLQFATASVHHPVQLMFINFTNSFHTYTFFSHKYRTTRRRPEEDVWKKTAKPSSRRLLLSIINKFVYVRMMLMMMMLWSGEEKIFRQSSAEIDLSSS